MNDIEKAMELLRREREASVASRSGAIPSEANPDAHVPSTSFVAREESSAGRSPDGDVARADEVLVESDGRARAGAPGSGVSPCSDTDAPEAAPCERATRRFDDTLFADDLIDGVGPASGAPASGPNSRPPGHATDAASGGSASEEAREAASEATAPDASSGDDIPLEHVDVDRKAAASEPERRGTSSERIVSLPLKRLAARGFLTPDVAKGRLSEEFRRVKRPILRNIVDAAKTDGHRNVVMITSSVAGEGKTYTAINLAMSLAAERKRTVLLVDADVLKGSAGTVLGLDEDLPGLVDVLDDEGMDVAKVMLATDVPDLRVIPAGRRDEHTTELLSSPRMSDLIDELARRYVDRIIVLDCPPMLQTNEANVIADHAGQVVFVVAGEETDQRLVLEAMERFDENTSVGILLNKASGSSAAYGYDYGYG